MNEHIPYWMALAHAGNFSNRRKMEFLIEVIHNKFPLKEALEKIKEGERDLFDFTEKEWNGIRQAVEEIPNYCFLAEQLNNKGIRVIPVMDKDYPATLKTNLKTEAPVILYAKGDPVLLKERSVAIVGARNSSKISLDFTDQVAAKGVKEGYVVVSGMARGVDRKALEAALDHNGRSIIVLPQGIETYRSKTYYSQIINGQVLVISSYHPHAPWSVGLAMDRNKIIYGLAEEIYVAESNDHGGTWEGVKNGLKRGRKIFVRQAGAREKNANNRLIAMGALPVNGEGDPVDTKLPTSSAAREPDPEYVNTGNGEDQDLTNAVLQILKERKGGGITLKEIKEALDLDDKTVKKLGRRLADHPEIKKIKQGRSNYFYLKKDLPDQKKIF